LYSQDTISYSSAFPFTQTSISVLNQLILPSYYVERDSTPTQQQVRVSTMSPYIEEVRNNSTIGVRSRSTALDNIAALSAPGIGTSDNIDEFIAAVKHLNKNNEGGFVGDLIMQLAPLASYLPF